MCNAKCTRVYTQVHRHINWSTHTRMEICGVATMKRFLSWSVLLPSSPLVFVWCSNE